MCYFIAVAVPAEYVEAVKGVVPRGFAAITVENRSIAAALPSGYQTFMLTSGGCSCGLYQPEVRAVDGADRTERLRQKFARRGWTEAKIDRALEPSASSQTPQPAFAGFHDAVVQILSAMAERAPQLAALVHWYDGRVDEERIDLGPPVRITPAQLDKVVPDKDRLLWINRRA